MWKAFECRKEHLFAPLAKRSWTDNGPFCPCTPHFYLLESRNARNSYHTACFRKFTQWTDMKICISALVPPPLCRASSPRRLARSLALPLSPESLHSGSSPSDAAITSSLLLQIDNLIHHHVHTFKLCLGALHSNIRRERRWETREGSSSAFLALLLPTTPSKHAHTRYFFPAQTPCTIYCHESSISMHCGSLESALHLQTLPFNPSSALSLKSELGCVFILQQLQIA